MGVLQQVKRVEDEWRSDYAERVREVGVEDAGKNVSV